MPTYAHHYLQQLLWTLRHLQKLADCCSECCVLNHIVVCLNFTWPPLLEETGTLSSTAPLSSTEHAPHMQRRIGVVIFLTFTHTPAHSKSTILVTLPSNPPTSPLGTLDSTHHMCTPISIPLPTWSQPLPSLLPPTCSQPLPHLLTTPPLSTPPPPPAHNPSPTCSQPLPSLLPLPHLLTTPPHSTPPPPPAHNPSTTCSQHLPHLLTTPPLSTPPPPPAHNPSPLYSPPPPPHIQAHCGMAFHTSVTELRRQVLIRYGLRSSQGHSKFCR